jgi:hypothetical protein
VYRDDSLITRMTLEKHYGPQALVLVTVKPAKLVTDVAHSVKGPLAFALAKFAERA